KGGDELRERQKASSTQQEHREKEQMIIPGDDVLHPKPKETGIVLRPLGTEGYQGLTCIRQEGDLVHTAWAFNARQGTVVLSQYVKPVIAYDELGGRVRTVEGQFQRDACIAQPGALQRRATRSAQTLAGAPLYALTE